MMPITHVSKGMACRTPLPCAKVTPPLETAGEWRFSERLVSECVCALVPDPVKRFVCVRVCASARSSECFFCVSVCERGQGEFCPYHYMASQITTRRLFNR